MRASTVCCLFISSLVVGCATSDADGTGAAPASGKPAVSVKDCGTFQQVRQDVVPTTDEAVRCFVEALQAKEPARLRFTSLTTEGDPIPKTYTARTDGRAEVLTDARQDQFSAPPDRIVTREICTGPQPRRGILMFAQCSAPQPAE